MTTIHLKGHVTEDGELVFDAPKDLPPGEAKITITYVQRQLTTEDESSVDDQDTNDVENESLR